MLFFFKDPAPTEIYTLSLHAALPFFARRGARRELDERTAPLAGLTAAFVFAVQMMNFPVGAGTSGHLIGGAPTAVLVRPWAAVVWLTLVLGGQAGVVPRRGPSGRGAQPGAVGPCA